MGYGKAQPLPRTARIDKPGRFITAGGQIATITHRRQDITAIWVGSVGETTEEWWISGRSVRTERYDLRMRVEGPAS